MVSKSYIHHRHHLQYSVILMTFFTAGCHRFPGHSVDILCSICGYQYVYVNVHMYGGKTISPAQSAGAHAFENVHSTLG